MQKYSVWQIVLSDEVINRVNAGEDVPEYNAYLQALMKGDPAPALELNLYRKVAKIEAEDLEDVFKIGNVGPEKNITRFGPMSSISVGNIIENKYGTRFVVAMFGFDCI